MADSLQSEFQRINITEQDLQSAGTSNSPIIPILAKSEQAASQSLALGDVSPICVLVVGMAGSGKTTLMAALQRSLAVPDDDDDEEEAEAAASAAQEGHEQLPVGYCLNLDPATKLVPFGASIDIRDTVNYKEVMKQHRLG